MNIDRVTWVNGILSCSESECSIRDGGIERALRDNETPGKVFVSYGGEPSATDMNRPSKVGSKSWQNVKQQSSRSRTRMESRTHGQRSRGINAIRAGMYAGEGESIGYGHVRSNLEDLDYSSSVDESEFNSEEETDPEAVTRGWIIDTVGTSESFHVREKSSYSGDRRFGDYYNRRSSSSTSTLRSPSAGSGNLFREGNFAEFHVHREVLRFRSPVFRQMLKDPRMNIIEVADTEAAVMEELLKFVYTGAVTLDSLTVLGEQLLAASSKYEMLHLKGQCEDVLSAAINADNALRLLYLADNNRALALKNNVCVYAQKEYKEIFRTPYFVQFQTDHPKLSNEFMTIIFSKPAK